MLTVKNVKQAIKENRTQLIATAVTAVVATVVIKHKINVHDSKIAVTAVQDWVDDYYNNGLLVFLAPRDMYENAQILADTALKHAA